VLGRFGSLLVGILAILPTSAWAEAGKSGMKNFQLGANMGVLDVMMSNSVGPQLGWSPYLHLSERLGVRGLFAVTVFNNASNSGSKFFAPEAQLLAALHLGKLLIEAGGGMQTWVNQDVNSPMYTVQVSIPFFVGERIYLGYSRLIASEARTSEFKFGLGFYL
jgi:hypothetical protein